MKGMQLKGAKSSVYVEILCNFSLIILTIKSIKFSMNYELNSISQPTNKYFGLSPKRKRWVGFILSIYYQE